ncbi:DNA polymerase III subunit epsilon [Arenicella chitinivorans]|uniref:DNA polymerase III subunit epsilon n=1 Tax=Arenicella chitinivorans TaxID=1329800 RepID=A0A918VG21_9GAMM|nr:DNA polymerase III subunit epsilon [Arenicella chitinivorans]GGZ98296.1 DNA polymerase III subunit epsilon [Arenicella chitinivorans]
MSEYDRQIVLDTETTGLEHRQGHRIIEIGCVELINRKLTGNNFHQYLNPRRAIDQGAIEVHGITNEFLADKPYFEDVAESLVNYLRGAELIIHNAAFDVGFLDAELLLVDEKGPRIEEFCGVHDTLIQARKMFPGQRNDLDSLCRRYEINNSHRELHGALLDAEILADVYLAMTGGQASLSLDSGTGRESALQGSQASVNFATLSLPLVQPSNQELQDHVEWLARLDDKVEGQCVWTRLNAKHEPAQ